LAPTPRAKDNLIKEGLDPKTIFVTGNTAVDALQWFAGTPWSFEKPALRRLFSLNSQMKNVKLILVTAHRRENFGRPFVEICQAIRQIARRHPRVHIIYPVHSNPNVRQTAAKILKGVPRITLLDPLGYRDFMELMKRSYLVLTDSGGIQEEAPALAKPVLILRKVTERPEAVEAGCARLMGELSAGKISKAAGELLENPQAYRRMARVANPFGDGKASERILALAKRFFGFEANFQEFRPV
ncbi:MAG: UDP-N-acetylglucosamine 2-epimerase (non-hydrolyzing), partial [Elusimicrobiota bacterium]